MGEQFIFKNNHSFKKICDPETLATLVKNSIEYYQENAKEATAQANKTYEEVKMQVINDYEEENKQLRKDYDLVYLRFNSYKERDAYRAFQEKHSVCRRTSKINGGKIPYLIPYETGFGTAYTVICPICGEKEDITNYNAW